MYFSTFYRSIKLDKKIMVENLVTSPKKNIYIPKFITENWAGCLFGHVEYKQTNLKKF